MITFGIEDFTDHQEQLHIQQEKLQESKAAHLK